MLRKPEPVKKHPVAPPRAAPAKPEPVRVEVKVEPVKPEAPKKTLDETISEALVNLQVEVAGGTPALTYKLLTGNAVETIKAALKEKGLTIAKSA